jgi:hypothetical protein
MNALFLLLVVGVNSPADTRPADGRMRCSLRKKWHRTSHIRRLRASAKGHHVTRKSLLLLGRVKKGIRNQHLG